MEGERTETEGQIEGGRGLASGIRMCLRDKLSEVEKNKETGDEKKKII